MEGRDQNRALHTATSTATPSLSLSFALLPFHFTLRFQIIFIMSAHLDAAPDTTS